MSATAPRVAVVGGGIAGLAAALRLVERAGPESFRLFEASSRLGGKILTERRDGFVLEGGPDAILAAKPAGVGLCRALGLGERLRESRPEFRRAYVRRRGRLHALPDGITGLVPSRLLPLVTTPALSLRGKLRAGLEPILPRRRENGDETIARFVSRRFGREVYDWLLEPLLGGIYAGDGAELSLRATFPQLAEMEKSSGSVLRAMVGRRPAGDTGGAPRGFVTLPRGLSELVEAVASRLPADRVRLEVPVRGLECAGEGWRVRLGDGSSFSATDVVVATPAHEAAPLVRDLDAALAEDLAAIRFVSTATVNLALDAGAVPRSFDGTGYVVPRAEGGPLVAVTWTTNKFEGRAPEGAVVLRCFLGRAGWEEVVGWEDERLLDLCREEIGARFGIRAEPLLSRVMRWPKALPQYEIGHLDRVERIERLASRHRGLHLVGHSYRGVGIPDCIASAEGAVERILARSAAA